VSRFATDTAVTPLGDGRYRGRMDTGWWIVRGPNGGYVAAMILRAILTELDDATRPPRSLTIHYLRPPTEGDVDILVTTERVGRTLTTLAARMVQAGRQMAIALCACATPQEGLTFNDATMPVVPGPGELDPLPAAPTDIPMRSRYEQRWAIGSPPGEATSDDPAEVGGWIRLAEDDPVDHVVVAALTDAWMPAIFNRMIGPSAVPTIDLTVHFREQPPLQPGWSLVRFHTRHASGGYLEESGEIWGADGRLLAESRQLAVFLPG
jgi:acyl-CoA thioesterase